jgi:hypothetical protein
MSTTALADGNTDFSTVMNLLLIRFGIIAIIVAILAIVVFTIALTLKRKGKLGATVKKIAPIAQSYADSRNQWGRNRRGSWKSGATTMVARYLTEQARREDRDR